MDFSQITLIGLLKQRLGYLSERQSVLAQNIANADTPGYKPRDLKKIDFGKLMRAQGSGTSLAVTHPGHIGGALGGGAGRFAAENDKNTFETTPTGNEVSLEDQAMKMAETSMDYQAATSLYKKMAELMRLAVGGGNG